MGIASSKQRARRKEAKAQRRAASAPVTTPASTGAYEAALRVDGGRQRRRTDTPRPKGVDEQARRRQELLEDAMRVPLAAPAANSEGDCGMTSEEVSTTGEWSATLMAVAEHGGIVATPITTYTDAEVDARRGRAINVVDLTPVGGAPAVAVAPVAGASTAEEEDVRPGTSTYCAGLDTLDDSTSPTSLVASPTYGPGDVSAAAMALIAFDDGEGCGAEVEGDGDNEEEAAVEIPSSPAARRRTRFYACPHVTTVGSFADDSDSSDEAEVPGSMFCDSVDVVVQAPPAPPVMALDEDDDDDDDDVRSDIRCTTSSMEYDHLSDFDDASDASGEDALPDALVAQLVRLEHDEAEARQDVIDGCNAWFAAARRRAVPLAITPMRPRASMRMVASTFAAAAAANKRRATSVVSTASSASSHLGASRRRSVRFPGAVTVFEYTSVQHTFDVDGSAPHDINVVDAFPDAGATPDEDVPAHAVPVTCVVHTRRREEWVTYFVVTAPPPPRLPSCLRHGGRSAQETRTAA